MEYIIHNSSANINLCKSHATHFFAIALMVSEILTFQIWDWKFWSRSRSTTIAIMVNGSARRQISTSIKVVREHFPLTLAVFEIFTCQSSWPWKCRSRSWCKKFAVAPFCGRYTTSYLMAIVMFALSLTICKIYAKLIKCQNFDLENEGQSQEEEKTGLAPLY